MHKKACHRLTSQQCRFPPEERAALLMVGRLTAALPYALRAHMLQAEEVDCYAQPVDLPADLKVRALSCMSSPVSGGTVGAKMLSFACHAAITTQA